jgi:uncharacterized protein YpuA (DUF1002 family)
MTPAIYPSTKVIEAAKDWRVTDKHKSVAHAEITNASTSDPKVVHRLTEAKKTAISKHRLSEQKLRAAVDDLARKGVQP